MTQLMVHRGPDDVGFWESDDVSLGMRRLSIVDVVTGKQPVANADETIWVVFNGEIYNHVELRKELEAAGHRFRTHHSDTEVLVHLYEEHGPAYLHRLNGMFAIALWDARRKELHLARDRAGIKPLFFFESGGRLIFGSEIKSILGHPSVPRSPNFQALHHFFSLKNIPAPWTAFDGIQQLRPGERAVWRNRTLQRHRWWQVCYQEKSEMAEDEAVETVRTLLSDSVRLRMRSDVPFGAYLSGGVDSSSVVALMARNGATNINTFSLTYQEDFHNKAADRHFAREVSQRYGTRHHEYVMSASDLQQSIEAVTEAFDEPFSGVTSTYFLTRLISKHVKVALSGDGADELFGSYLSPRLAQPLHALSSLGERAGHLSEAELRSLMPFDNNVALLQAILQRGDEASRRMGQYLWDEPGKASLYSPAMRSLVQDSSTERLIRALYDAAGTGDPLNRALFVDFETLLPDQVLAFVDRLSMAHSVEVRPPFLDFRLMEFAATIPGRRKIRAGRVKHVLKEAVRGLIPDAIIDRPKEGFVLPLNHWLMHDLRAFVSEVLAPERLRKHGLLQEASVQQLLAQHGEGRSDLGPRIWTLMIFQVWWEKYFNGPMA